MTPIHNDHLARPNGTVVPNRGALSEPPATMPRVFDARGSGVRGHRLPGISGYRVFMTIIFVSVIFVDQWADRRLSAAVGAVVGPVSVVVWMLTLLGSFDIGPVAALWRAMRR